jgi:CSLREA domain-containing protein
MISPSRLTARRLAAPRTLVLLVIVALVIPASLSGPAPAYAATFTVDSTLDEHDINPGDRVCRTTTTAPFRCTLRAAIEEANFNPDLDVISVPAGTYTLPLGELRITTSMNIVGAGVTATIVQAATAPGVANHRVFFVEGNPGSQITVRVERLAIQHGNPDGPGSTDLGSGGGVRLGPLAALTLDTVSIRRNAADRGGAIAILSSTSMGTSLVLRDSTVFENTARLSASGLTCVNSVDVFNPPPTSRYPSWQIVTSSLVANASSGFHGAVVSISCNGVLERSLVAQNTASSGAAGLSFQAADFRLTNSTISSNVARPPTPTTAPGTVMVGGIGYFTGNAVDSRLRFENVTIANNQAIDGPEGISQNLRIGFDGDGSTPPDAVQMRNSIVSQYVGTGPNCIFGGPPYTAITSLGGNFEFPRNTCRLTTPPSGSVVDLINFDPRLGPLQNNGGLTLTHALATTSRAVDRVPFTSSTCPSTDQRGLPRPRDGNGDGIARCDSGAFEVQSGSTGLFSVTPADATVQVGDRLTSDFIWTVPAPSNWHDLSGLDFRLQDASGIALWVHWDEASNTFTLVDPATGDTGPTFVAGSANQLEGAAATLFLAESSVQGSGPTGPSVTLRLRLGFTAAAAGHTFAVEVLGADDQGTVQGFETAGTLHVLGAPGSDPNNNGKGDKKDKDEKDRETEDERRNREHTNAGNRDDVHTEGTVLSVSPAPTGDGILVEVALGRGGAERVTVFIRCAAGQCPAPLPGDYVEADGYPNDKNETGNTWFVADESWEFSPKR